MSGGQWDYFDQRFGREMAELCEDIKERFPELSVELLAKSKLLCKIIHELDWDYSGDTIIKSDKVYEKRAIKRLRNIK